VFLTRYTEAWERIKQNYRVRATGHNDQNCGFGKKIGKNFPAVKNGLTNLRQVNLIR